MDGTQKQAPSIAQSIAILPAQMHLTLTPIEIIAAAVAIDCAAVCWAHQQAAEVRDKLVAMLGEPLRVFVDKKRDEARAGALAVAYRRSPN